MMSPDRSPVTAWQSLVHSQLSFISLLTACALFLACPFTTRNAEKPVLWLIAALPSTPMGQDCSSSSPLTHSLGALQPPASFRLPVLSRLRCTDRPLYPFH